MGYLPKTITIPEKKFANLSTAEKNVVENATVLVPLLATLSANSLTGGSITSSELKTLTALQTKLNKIESKGIKDKDIKDLNLEMTAALKQIADYQKKKDRKLLEKVQQHLLTFMADYYSF